MQVFATLDDLDALLRMPQLSVKEIRKCALRGNDVAIGLAIDELRSELNREEPRYFRRRARGLLKDFRRMARLYRATFSRGLGSALAARAEVVAVGMGGSRMRAAAPLEVGGKYQQFVEAHTRRVKGRDVRERVATASGRRRMTTIAQGYTQVREHLRMRPEDAHRYLLRAVQAKLSVMIVPTIRALAGLIATGKVPTAKTLRAGL